MRGDEVDSEVEAMGDRNRDWKFDNWLMNKTQLYQNVGTIVNFCFSREDIVIDSKLNISIESIKLIITNNGMKMMMKSDEK